jgi:hypothetical protein
MKRLLTATGMALAIPLVSQAGLVNSYQFNGNGNWSIDAAGSNNTPVADLSAFVPLGATVEKAFLYSSNIFGNLATPSVNFDGTTVSGADWTSLGTTNSLTAYRADVTSQVASKVGGGSASLFTFSILSENPNFSIDGEVLAIVYSLPTEAERTIAFLDGFSVQDGDTTTINLSTALTASQLADPAFSAQLSLGIGYSAGGGQFSQVDVNGSRLSTSAGGADDGSVANGASITAGGLGDDPANPLTPNVSGTPDDELYTLVPFLTAGDTQIVINTLNPSHDDNIFFAALNITARGGVNQPPPDTTPTVPDGGSTAILLGVGLFSMVLFRAKSKRA